MQGYKKQSNCCQLKLIMGNKIDKVLNRLQFLKKKKHHGQRIF